MADRAGAFLEYLRRRIRRLTWLTVLLLGVGVPSVTAVNNPVGLGVGVVLLVFAALLSLSVFKGQTVLWRGVRTLDAGSRSLQMSTYPVHGRGGPTIAVLATFDDLESTNRTPLAEVKTSWFTSGIAEKPTSVAEVFGTFEPGTVMVAVSEHGGIVGKVKRLSPESSISRS